MDWFANRYINLRVYGGKEDLPERITVFMQEDPARKALIQRKVLESSSYTALLELLDTSSGHSKDHDLVAVAAPDGNEQDTCTTQDFLAQL